MLGVLVAVVALTGAPGKLSQADALEGKSGQVLDSWLNKVLESIPVKIRPQKVVAIEDENVQQMFPGDRFYGVSFATWPVAPRLPMELSHETVVRVRNGESVEPIRDGEALRTFLARALSEVHDERQAGAAALASLRLAQAVAKAGADAFEKPHVSVARQDSNIVATARAVALEPARGEVTIRLEFDADGKIKPDAIKIEDRSRRGPPSR